MIQGLLKYPIVTYIRDSLYHQFIRMMPLACVDVSIIHDEEVILVRRKDAPAKDQWWVPGGRVLKGEMMVDAARRKCKEEINLTCTIGPIIHTAETIFPDGPYGVPIHSINSCFLAWPKNHLDISGIKLDNHHSGLKWVGNIDDSLHEYVKCCLRGAGLK